MPKTTKKSKASKANGLKKRFDLNNKRVQFFVVVGIVALLGGGWFTYKSFAANVLKTWTVPTNLACGHLNRAGQNGCNVVSDPQKNNSSVVVLSTDTSAQPTLSGITITRNSPVKLTGNRKYDVCALVKGVGQMDIRLTQTDSSGASFHGDLGAFKNIQINSPSGYTEYCNTVQTPGSQYTTDYYGTYIAQNREGGLISVSNATVKPSASPIPTSGSSK